MGSVSTGRLFEDHNFFFFNVSFSEQKLVQLLFKRSTTHEHLNTNLEVKNSRQKKNKTDINHYNSLLGVLKSSQHFNEKF